MNRKPELIVALDVNNYKEALNRVRLLYPRVKIFKVGLELYTACGPRIIEGIRKQGARVFLDLKLNDIPNTMVRAAKEAVKQKVAMFTVHTLSGPAALKEVSRAVKGSNTKALGVTILTSINPHFLQDLKIGRSLPQEVAYLTKLAKSCGLDGIVCSVQEARMIRNQVGGRFIILTPGIRPAGVARGDQERIATPQEAAKAGANFIVVGRPILEAKYPLKAAQEILRGIQGD